MDLNKMTHCAFFETIFDRQFNRDSKEEHRAWKCIVYIAQRYGVNIGGNYYLSDDQSHLLSPGTIDAILEELGERSIAPTIPRVILLQMFSDIFKEAIFLIAAVLNEAPFPKGKVEWLECMCVINHYYKHICPGIAKKDLLEQAPRAFCIIDINNAYGKYIELLSPCLR